MVFIFLLLLILSFLLALRSMKDLDVPVEIERLVRSRKIKGSIVFLKNKIKHYSSLSPSSSSELR
jgi:hypothetical protein